MQKIISYNVAGLRARIPLVQRLMDEEAPDFLLLQEIKVTNETLPFSAFKGIPYHLSFIGQKSFNGVAVFSKQAPDEIITALPDLKEEIPQARFIEARFQNRLSVISVYVPNGNPPEKDPADTTRFNYKLDWMATLTRYIGRLIDEGRSFIIGGDFNVIAQDSDVYNPDAYRQNALMLPPVRQAFQTFAQTGVVNTLRHMTQQEHLYSFWDFQSGAWRKNNGMLLDYIFVSPDLKAEITDCRILKPYRGFDKPSDHVPVCCVLK